MDGLTLLQDAAAAGLTVLADGDRLVVRGPRSAEPVARRLLENKADVMAALAGLPSGDPAGGAEPADPFADWVQRPDYHGRMGWEAPNLPEWQRWWARCDFNDLPVVSEGFRMGEIPEPSPQDCACCVSAVSVDTLDLDSKRPAQAMLGGFAG